MDLNNNIGEIKTMKKQKAEQKRRLEEERLSKQKEDKQEEPKNLPKQEVKPNPFISSTKTAIPNYRNNFKK